MAEFVKDVMKPGTYRKGDKEIIVTEGDIAHWVDEFSQMRSLGIEVAVPWEHPDPTTAEAFPVDKSDKRHKARERSRLNAGWVKDFFVDEHGTLQAKIDIPRAEDASKVGEIGAFVSPQFGDFKLGGRQFKNAIGHLALTPTPVNTDQSKVFTPVAVTAMSQVQFSLADQVQMGMGDDDHLAALAPGVKNAKPAKKTSQPADYAKAKETAETSSLSAHMASKAAKSPETHAAAVPLHEAAAQHHAAAAAAAAPYTATHSHHLEAVKYHTDKASEHRGSSQMSQTQFSDSSDPEEPGTKSSDDDQPKPADDQPPVLPNAPKDSDRLMDALRQALVPMNIILPDTCKLSGDLDVFIAAVASAQAAGEAAKSKPDDAASDMSGVQKEPSTVSMSAADQTQMSATITAQATEISALQKRVTENGRKEYTGRINGAFDSGRCTVAQRDKLLNAAGQWQFSAKDQGESALDIELGILEGLPEGAVWTAEQKVTQMSIERHPADSQFFAGPEPTDERADEIMEETWGWNGKRK